MDYFSPGIRELRRIADRCRNRWQLRRARRQLDESETHLGLLGWQQAEFDPATQKEVEKLMNFEREQARLNNECATISRAIAELAAERDEVRKQADAQRAPFAAESEETRKKRDETESEVRNWREQLAAAGKRAAQLERELKEADRLYTELLATEHPTPEIRDEQARFRERTVALATEIADAKARRARSEADLEAARQTIAATNARDAELAAELGRIDSARAARERELAEAIKAKEREKLRLEKEIAKLEREKENPYLEIGRVLADSHLAPLNQPQALDEVRNHRLRVQEVEYEIAKSLSDSAQENQTLLRHSLLVLGAIALAILLVIGALVPW